MAVSRWRSDGFAPEISNSWAAVPLAGYDTLSANRAEQSSTHEIRIVLGLTIVSRAEHPPNQTALRAPRQSDTSLRDEREVRLGLRLVKSRRTFEITGKTRHRDVDDVGPPGTD